MFWLLSLQTSSCFTLTNVGTMSGTVVTGLAAASSSCAHPADMNVSTYVDVT